MPAATSQYYYLFRICWCRCLQNGKVYQQTKFRRHISIDGWDITTPFLVNKRPPYWNSTFGFDLDHLHVICMLFCIRLPNFGDIGACVAEIWRRIHFLRWRPRALNTTSGFVFIISLPSEGQNLSAYQIIYRHISIDNWYITTSAFKKQTSAILEFYRGLNFWFFWWFLHGPYNSAALMRCLWWYKAAH